VTDQTFRLDKEVYFVSWIIESAINATFSEVLNFPNFSFMMQSSLFVFHSSSHLQGINGLLLLMLSADAACWMSSGTTFLPITIFARAIIFIFINARAIIYEREEVLYITTIGVPR